MSQRIAAHELLLDEIRGCRHCEAELPLGANPVVQFHPMAKILIIGQAPGTRVHASGIPWDDPSGNRLRTWLNVDKPSFYNPEHFAIMPMGFCYPGKGKSGDLPPRKECAPLWHQQILKQLPNIELVLLIGQYSQKHYLDDAVDRHYKNLTERVLDWQSFTSLTPVQLPLPHPSPRNRRWFAQHSWFDDDVVPWLQQRVRQLL